MDGCKQQHRVDDITKTEQLICANKFQDAITLLSFPNALLVFTCPVSKPSPQSSFPLLHSAMDVQQSITKGMHH